MAETNMIDFNNVSMSYATNDILLKNASMHIKKGEFVFLIGKSGSGKSTILRLLLKELDPIGGEIVVNDNKLSEIKKRHIPAYRRQIGMIFQDFRLLPDRTVFENIAFPLEVIGKDRNYIKTRVNTLLDTFSLKDREKSLPSALSGGEQQRVSIARALAASPTVILADEPTGNLDPVISEEIMQYLAQVRNQNVTVIMATHDMATVNKHPDYSIIMVDDGEIKRIERKAIPMIQAKMDEDPGAGRIPAAQQPRRLPAQQPRVLPQAAPKPQITPVQQIPNVQARPAGVPVRNMPQAPAQGGANQPQTRNK